MSGKIFRKTGTVVMMAAVLVCLLLAGVLGAARLNGYELLSVQSDSMSPMIKAGDVVIVSEATGIPQPGDIVSFASPLNSKVIITHRVVSVNTQQGTFVAMGDAALIPDPPAPIRNIIGNVTRHAPFVGRILDVFRHPVGLALVVYLPSLGIVVAEIRHLSQYYNDPSERTRPGKPSRIGRYYRLHGAFH